MAIRLFLSSLECRAVPLNYRMKGVKTNEEGCQMGGGWLPRGMGPGCGAPGPRAGSREAAASSVAGALV